MTEIRPALTERQWKEGHYLSPGQAEFYLQGASLNVGGNKWDSDSTHDSPDDLAALAAMALAALPEGHPLKITRETVTAMTQAAHYLENAHGHLSTYWPVGGNPWHALAADIRREAAKLAALLPPEGV